MEQGHVDKYNVAWFRLAEYISRGEKERALGMYRLLCHSFDDAAFARQLEADILYSFNDRAATEKYYEAAQLYQQDKRMLQAAAVYENLHRLAPGHITYLEQLVQVYSHLELKAKVILYMEQLASRLMRKNHDVHARIDEIGEMLNVNDIPLWYRYCTVAAIKEGIDQAIVHHCISQAMEKDTIDGQQELLNDLRSLNQDAYSFALSCK